MYLSIFTLAAAYTVAFGCDSSNPCPLDEICSSGSCVSISSSFSSVLPSLATPPSSTAAFNLFFVSDAQFYYTTCKDAPKKHCLYNKLLHTYNDVQEEKDALDDAAVRQLDCLNALTSTYSPVAVLDGGDLTNHGKDAELQVVEPYHVNLETVAPLMFLLGNHDYAYDSSHPSGRYTERGVLRMLDYFIRKIPSVPNVISIDFKVASSVPTDEGRRIGTRYIGSMSYAVEINDHVFFMLHWGAAISTGTFTYEIEGRDPLAGDYRFYDITSMTEWLETEATAAHAANKKLVLVPHSKKAFTDYVTTASVSGAGTVGDLLGNLNFVALISGHDHDAWGLQSTQFALGSSNLNVFYGGSLSYETLAVLQFDGTGGVTAAPYDTSSGASCTVIAADDEN